MPGYTSDEIQAVVEKLVLSTIRRPYDTLGVRRTDLSFNDIQQAAAGVFVLYPNSPFYVLWLGVQRLADLIASESVIIDQLLDALEATGLHALPVEDVSTLFNAKAALQELGTAAAKRGGLFSDVTKAPAYQRYSSNIQQFLSGPGANVKNQGAIVQTPQQARTVIPGLMTQLLEAHTLLLARVSDIAAGIEDYNKVNLPAAVTSSALSNSADLIGADADALEALSPTDRLALIRQTVLDVLSTRAVVTTFGSFTGPSDFYTLDGLGNPFSDSTRLATPAQAQGTVTDAAGIVAGVNDGLTFAMDGGAPFSITLNPSLLARLNGQNADTGFIIGDGTQPISAGTAVPNNNKVKVKVDGIPYTATLTVSGAPTAATLTGTGDTSTAGWYGGGGTLNTKTFNIIVDGLASYAVTFAAPANVAALLSQINAVTNVGTAQHRVVATNVANRLVLTTVVLGLASGILIDAGTANAILGFTQGQYSHGTQPIRTAEQVATNIQAALPAGVTAEGYYALLKYSGGFNIPAGVDQVWAIPVPGASDLLALGVTTSDTVHVLAGPNAGIYPITNVTASTITVTGVTVLEASANSEIGPASRYVRIRCSDAAAQLAAETELVIYGDDTPSTNALSTLGFFNGLTSSCKRTTADLVAADITSKTQALTAEPFFKASSTLVDVPARTDVSNPFQVSLMRAQATGSQSFVGLTLTYTVASLSRAGSVAPGDVLVLREGPNPGQWYTVLTINGSPAATPHTLAVGDVIVAVGTLTGAPDPGALAELGPPVAAIQYDALTVNSGPSAGTYYVESQGLTPLDIILQQALPQTLSGVSPLDIEVTYGGVVLLLKSINKSTSSQITASGSSLLLFFSSSPTTTRGTTPWFKLPALPRGLQAGDLLETYLTDYKAPSASYKIAGVSGLVLQLSPEIPSDVSWQFTVQPPPFGRLRVGTLNDYSLVKALLDTWLAQLTNQPSWFTNFYRLVNPLLVNTNPTAVQIGSATNELKAFYSFLLSTQAAVLSMPTAQALDSILATFTVERVPEVDVLLQSFIAKGASRSTDLLLAGQFSTFFNLTMDGTSYAGAFQEAARAVAMNDLAVRKFNRKEAYNSQLKEQTQSPDFEYTSNAVTEAFQGEAVDPPTSFGEPSDFGKK